MLNISDHAVDRFIERVEPGTTAARARARLEVLASSAARLKKKTKAGDAIYVVDGVCRLIVRPSDRGEVGGVVITVLPPEDAVSEEFDLQATMQALLGADRGVVLETLNREQLAAVKAQLTICMKEASTAEVEALNALVAIVNVEIRKHPAQDNVRDLRRALGKMIHKYGWLSNEQEYEVYRRVKEAMD